MLIIRVTITGPQGSGKTLIADAIRAIGKLVGANVIVREVQS